MKDFIGDFIRNGPDEIDEGLRQEAYEEIFSHLPEKFKRGAKNILEVGVKWGIFHRANTGLEHALYHAVDMDHEALDSSRLVAEAMGKRMVPALADAGESIPFNRMDMVLDSWGAMRYGKDRDKVLKNEIAALKDGGYLLLISPDVSFKGVDMVYDPELKELRTSNPKRLFMEMKGLGLLKNFKSGDILNKRRESRKDVLTLRENGSLHKAVQSIHERHMGRKMDIQTFSMDLHQLMFPKKLEKMGMDVRKTFHGKDGFCVIARKRVK